MNDDISHLSKEPEPSFCFELPSLDLKAVPDIDLDGVPDVDFSPPDVSFDFPDATQESES